MKKLLAIVSSMGLIAVGAVLGASTAEAAGPNYIETSNTVACGAATITLHNVSPWIYPVSVMIDGVHSYGPTVDNRTDTNGDGSLDLNGPQKDASATRTITFGEDTGTHTVKYRVDAGTENDLYVGLPVGEWTTLTVGSDCLPPPNLLQILVTLSGNHTSCTGGLSINVLLQILLGGACKPV